MRQPSNFLERTACKLTFWKSFFLWLIPCISFILLLVYCCKTVQYNPLLFFVLIFLFVISGVLIYVCMLTTAYSLLKHADETIQKLMDEIEE